CAERANVVRLEAPAPPALVERGPYLVELSDSTAVIRWTTRRPLASGLELYAANETIVGRTDTLRRSHTFRLRGLRPRSRYAYRILLAESVRSTPVTFMTFPRPGERVPITFLVVEDTGSGGPDQLSLARVLNREEAGFLLHVGDIAYPAGTVRTYSDRFFAVYRPLLARAAFFPVPGNHDLLLGGQAFIEAFTPPDGRASGSPFHYAFTVGNARFIALQFRSRPRTRLARGHRIGTARLARPRAPNGALRPAYRLDHRLPAPSPLQRLDRALRIWLELESPRGPGTLFDAYGVHLVFAGHDHDYHVRRRSVARRSSIRAAAPSTM
ncbi:MAG: metallophosphoesterase, partial [Acidimicrobiia bacterium]